MTLLKLRHFFRDLVVPFLRLLRTTNGTLGR
jgi:hypothetical protein